MRASQKAEVVAKEEAVEVLYGRVADVQKRVT